MFKQLCRIFLLVLTFTTTAVAANNQSESLKSSLADSSKTEEIQKKDIQIDKESLPESMPESDTQDDEPSVFDDEHG